MERQKLIIICKLIYTLLGILIVTTYAKAMWSIIAVDRTTGEVGVASASCSYRVQGVGSCITLI